MTLIWSAVVAAASTWVLGSVALGDDGVKCIQKVIVTDAGAGGAVTLSGEEDESDVHVVVKCVNKGDGSEALAQSIVLVGDKSDGTGESTAHANAFFFSGGEEGQTIRMVLRKDAEADATGGWLGVQIGSTTDDEGAGANGASGVMVLNVIKDSPAETAGFEQDDEVIEVNDEAIGGDVGALVERIREAGSGSRVKFTVLRDGQRRTLVATLGSRTDMDKLHWIHETTPDALLQDSLRTRMRVLLQGEDAEWHLKDLTELSELGDLSSVILKALPNSKDKTVRVFVSDGGTTVSVTATENGESITVQRTDDGEIVVTRSSEGQDGETVTRYADEEALAAGDAEAYEVYKEVSKCVVVELDADQASPHFDFDFDFDSDDLDLDLDSLLENLDDRIKSSMTRSRDLEARLRDLHKQGFARTFKFRTGRASRSIHQNSDGTIEVIIRKGDNELVTHYSSADDLRDSSPEDYDVYMDMLTPEEDE